MASKHSWKKPKNKLGHLQMCVDRRYVHKLQEKFQEVTGLKAGDYWMHTEAGGSPKMEDSCTSPDYAYKNGARIMAWCAHGSFCGGYGGPDAGVPDKTIMEDLKKTLNKKVKQYDKATHYAFFITDEGTPGTICHIGPIKP